VADVITEAKQAGIEAQNVARDFAEKGTQQAKEFYERSKVGAEKASELFETSIAQVSRGAQDFGMKAIEAARDNANATFDFALQLMSAKSLSQAVELQSGFARKQFETFTEQAKELTAIAQKSTAETVRPFQDMAAKGGFRFPQ
jgi:phasin